MGNSQPHYLTNDDAISIIGGQTWDRLRNYLVRFKEIDYFIFRNIVQSKFDLIPKVLIERLYSAFARDINSKLDINSFISTLAVISGQDRVLVLRFLFRIYDAKSTNVIQRDFVKEILVFAYGKPFIAAEIDRVKRLLDSLFLSDNFMYLREFEQYKGRLDLLGGWVQVVLGTHFSSQLQLSTHSLIHSFHSIRSVY